MTVETADNLVSINGVLNADLTEDDTDVSSILAAINASVDVPAIAVDTLEDVIVATEAAEDAASDEPVDLVGQDVEEILAAIAPASASTKSPKTTKPAKPAKEVVLVVSREYDSVATKKKADFSQLINESAKKVREKADNLIAAIESGRKLSRYTSIAVNELMASGKVSGKSLVDVYVNCGLGLGTARAQSQQITSLFKMAGLAAPLAAGDRDLVLSDSSLGSELRQLAA
jgi:transcriptional regulator with PAS, ATPase and Fis domain